MSDDPVEREWADHMMESKLDGFYDLDPPADDDVPVYWIEVRSAGRAQFDPRYVGVGQLDGVWLDPMSPGQHGPDGTNADWLRENAGTAFAISTQHPYETVHHPNGKRYLVPVLTALELATFADVYQEMIDNSGGSDVEPTPRELATILDGLAYETPPQSQDGSGRGPTKWW